MGMVYQHAADRCVRWALECAAPIWAANGVDMTTGRFVERLALKDGKPTNDPARTIVQARQIYSFSTLGKMGWSGPWQAIVRAGLRFLETTSLNQDGAYIYATNANGGVADAKLDLYTHAFIIFTLATVARDIPDLKSKNEAEALRILNLLRNRLGASKGGFHASFPRGPLLSNPHMHLFEACLAWIEVSPDDTWVNLAQDLANSALDKFIVQSDGMLREFFDDNWQPAEGLPGRTIEPGHQFEWAWLLARWGIANNDNRLMETAKTLASYGERLGVDTKRRAVVQSILPTGEPLDSSARLWPQTERLKAQLLLAERDSGIERIKREAAVLESVRVLFGYFETEVPGLWRDRQESDGQFRIEAAPASSFYHILCAILELARAAAMGQNILKTAV